MIITHYYLIIIDPRWLRPWAASTAPRYYSRVTRSCPGRSPRDCTGLHGCAEVKMLAREAVKNWGCSLIFDDLLEDFVWLFMILVFVSWISTGFCWCYSDTGLIYLGEWWFIWFNGDRPIWRIIPLGIGAM